MKKKIKGIYLIERIEMQQGETRKYYVGQSVDIFARLNQHCSENNNGIDEAISSFGFEKFSFRILEKVKYVKELNDCELKWINYYRNQYGDSQMYNISQTTNPCKQFDISVKNEIKSLFVEDIGRSIYAIAEFYDISYKDVIKIRKPLLSKQGLKWISGKIINKNSGREPDNWRGGRITKKTANKIDSILLDSNSSVKDIDFVSSSDLDVYLKSKGKYDYAPLIEVEV